MVKEIRGLKCPNHDYVRDNHHFMYQEAYPGARPLSSTRCIKCGYPMSLKSADGNVFENGANLVGAAICAIGCLTPFHYAAGKAAQSLWKEGTKSVKITYKCQDCGCTWEETKWT